ncbi:MULTISPECIES: zinc dependent phospholipase C family protein [Sphingobacterium]|jgi:hypothetical protein|uniref:zinc dependent phospholipase C family protein n=1 Tax=Sphingobacterium TaxID=28453 RepID=UPI0004E5F2F8|nr:MULTISPECIES: zinc dependent phospholipase C family protein [Sphingobacterium]UPZ35991.1 zinc dependent phospholipase C family protein [Sphingobacterium sp. PCS056]WGQ15181.1 zinc dependent phospholipase C family protein [Sphingobacterium faecium]CDS93474.1 conserved exported hypothetical protein [Sphingobacterium sp. PM2-P1-29]
MKRLSFIISLFIIFLLCGSWGFFAHKKINEYAVYTLPPTLASFYKKNILLISEKAVDADKRCYIDSLEPTRHYIDIDDFDEPTIDSIPIHWSKAKEKYQEKQLLLTGIVPWQISFSYNKLVQAFKDKDIPKIIRFSADLGHYIGDAHVPLHTTKNYNGQLTNQIGIHAFWESRLPEMFSNKYVFIKGRAQFISDPITTAWDIVKESNRLVDSVLMLEKQLNNSFSKYQKYAFIERNNILIRTYSDEYANAYHQLLNGMVERRMTGAIQQVGAFWYSAWVEAGQPNLKNIGKVTIDEAPINTRNKKNMGREEL